MQLSQLANSYKTTAISTATPGQLVLMLFDGALRFLATASHGFQTESLAKRNEQISNNLIKAQRIIRELQQTLDMKNGGEFATTMFPLYGFMIDQLQQSNLNKDPAPIATVERLLGDIRDSWSLMLGQTASAAA